MAHYIPELFLTEKDYQERAQRLVERILLFADLLRKNRVPIHTADELDTIAALQYVDINSLFEFYMALKTTLLVSYKYFPIFDQLFLQFWRAGENIPKRDGDTSEDQEGEQNSLMKQSDSEEYPDEQQNSVTEQSGSEEDADVQSKKDAKKESNPYAETSVPTYSLSDTLRKKDFEDIQPAELAVFDEIFKSLRINVKEKKGRRFKSSNKGKTIDLPKSIRQSRQKGGEIVKIFTKEKKPKHAKLVLLADVSGSMDIYSTFLIKFIYELQKYVRDAETFVFGTRLKRITYLLSYRSIRTALSMLSQNVLFWSGGTDIGGSFLEFNNIYGGKLRKRSRILVILSDGWDMGDIETLKKQMAVFKRGFKKIIWLNPNLKYDNYQPLCMGMAAAMPYVDYFLPCHNLKTLETFIETVKKI
ncbi:MAG: VWA domain-containing protein [Syntrophales bacterium]|nr:VWA domain-containing protein [Syntrophales bacterium]